MPDPKIKAFNTAINNFKDTARGAKVVLVYYSGHGIEYETVNYLLRVDCTLDSPEQLPSEAVNLGTLLTGLKATGSPACAVILDCCRDKPIDAAWTKSATDANVLRALGEAEIPEATMIVFASSSGRKAAARLSKFPNNSPFTGAFLEQLASPGLSLRDIFDKVEDAVTAATSGRQTPVVKYGGSSRVFRELVFLPAPTTAPRPSPSSPRTSSASTTWAAMSASGARMNTARR